MLLVVAADRPNRLGGGQRGLPASEFHAAVPAHPFDLILARPTENSMTLSVLSYQNAEARIVYGTQADKLNEHTTLQTFKAGVLAEIVLRTLKPDT